MFAFVNCGDEQTAHPVFSMVICTIQIEKNEQVRLGNLEGLRVKLENVCYII